MAFINISSVYTADPSDIWTPKNAFLLNDPYAIVQHIQADSSVVSEACCSMLCFKSLALPKTLSQDSPGGSLIAMVT